MILILNILNSLGILVILYKMKIITISLRRDVTYSNKTLVGYNLWINKKLIRIPIRNKRKLELQEEVLMMIGTYSYQAKLQRLTAAFSWLKTWEEVRQFEKDYSVVDRKIVANLVSNFKPKNKFNN